MTLPPLIRLMRPRQWIKNAFVFAPLFFAMRFFSMEAWWLTLLAAFVFICASSAVYIFNDLNDIEEDKRHPVKSLRPLAAGQVSQSQAKLAGLALIAMGLACSFALPWKCGAVIAVYVVMNAAYTLHFKHVAIADALLVASMYVLRVLMGGYALQVFISPWIILTTFLLALLLSFGKRYHETSLEDYAQTKPALRDYTRHLLDRLVAISAGAALITYAIYAAETARQYNKLEYSYTVIFVAFGLFRYLQLLYVRNMGGEPETILLRDRPFQINLLVWLVVTLALLA